MAREFQRYARLLAGNVRTYRKALRLSQEQLALDADVDRSFVSRIERGLANPSLQVLCKIASVLKVHPKALFEDSPSK